MIDLYVDKKSNEVTTHKLFRKDKLANFMTESTCIWIFFIFPDKMFGIHYELKIFFLSELSVNKYRFKSQYYRC